MVVPDPQGHLARLAESWRGRPAVLAGGGDSLRDFDWHRLDGLNVIAINRAYEVLPCAQVVAFSDTRFTRSPWLAPLRSHSAIKVTTIADAPRGFLSLGVEKVRGLDKRLGCVASGKNTGHVAVNVAYWLGANPIVCIGFAMTGGHWHEGYGAEVPDSVMDRKAGHWATQVFPHLARDLAREARRVVVARPTRLTCFETMELDDALALARRPPQ